MFKDFSSQFLASISQPFQPQDRIHNNTVNILDTGDPCMHIFNLEHVLLRRIISRGDSPVYEIQGEWFFCIDSMYNILIPDYVTQEVKIFDSFGKLMNILGSKGNCDGQLFKPKFIANNSSMVVVICN